MERAEAAFHRLVRERGDALARSAYLLTGSWGKAEDLVQSALAATWTHWRGLRDEAAAEAYARRCMARTASAWWRRRWTGEVPTERLPERATAAPYDDVDTAHAVVAALNLLTPRQRTVLVLRYFDDLPEHEVAALLGCSVGNVKSTASRALDRLRAADVWDGLVARPAVVTEEAPA